MKKEEKREILAASLARFRSWPYRQLADLVERTAGHHLEVIEETSADGTSYRMEFDIFWDDKSGGDVRVLGSFSVVPSRPLWGFIPLYFPDVCDSFIKGADERFIGE